MADATKDGAKDGEKKAGARRTGNRALVGRLLVAMPTLAPDSNFSRTVIYVCEATRKGTMGIVINRAAERISFPTVLQQLGIEASSHAAEIRVQLGGPVGEGRGFVVHSDDYFKDSTMRVAKGVALTGTVDILHAISAGEGPRKSFLALGYAGWGAGQLETELAQNAWLTATADEALLFGADLEQKWARAIRKLGIDPSQLSPQSGNA